MSPADLPTALPPGPHVLSPKLDGETWFVRAAGGEAWLLSPTGRVIADVPATAEAARLLAGRDVLLAGELYANGRSGHNGRRPRVHDLYAWGCAKATKRGTGLSPKAYIYSKEGQIAFTDDPENFRLTLFVKCASLPGICFRYWHWNEKYRFDVMEGTLTKYAQGRDRVLATASSPVFTEAERSPGGPKPWKLLEITAREGQFRIRLSADGKTWVG